MDDIMITICVVLIGICCIILFVFGISIYDNARQEYCYGLPRSDVREHRECDKYFGR